jgi:hypothetical protein
LTEDADWWINHRLNLIKENKEALDTVNEPDAPLVGYTLFNVIREVKPDGSEPLIGSLGFIRCPWMEISNPGGANWEEKEARVKENEARELGDPEILWTVGCECSILCSRGYGELILQLFQTTLPPPITDKESCLTPLKLSSTHGESHGRVSRRCWA